MRPEFDPWLLLVLAIFVVGSPRVSARDPIVFISSFADGDKAALHAYRLDVEAGKLIPLHRTTEIDHPFFLAISSDHRFLFSIHANTFGGEAHEEIAAYEIEDRTGRLRFLNRRSSQGTASCYLDVDTTGECLVVANYSTGSVAALPIKADGALGPPSSFHQHVGASVDPARQSGPHAHCMVISPDNRFAFAADLGLDQIVGYRLEPSTATLTRHPVQPFVRTLPGAGPRHMAFHPTGAHAYVINELHNSVTRFAYDAESGMLIEHETIATLPKSFRGTSHCADLKITPDGRFLYGTNRGHDSIAAYRIDATGKLTLTAIVESMGQGPQNLAITSDGSLLLCANMPGNNVAVFRIDQETGDLLAVGSPVEQPGPSCIMLVP